MTEPAKKILHIEDEKTIQLVVKGLLEREGYRVTSAMDAMQGMMMARQTLPDLIILDITMPAGGGTSVFERVRMLNTTAHIPILIYSGADPESIKTRIPLDTETRFLKKPAPPAEFLVAVKSLLSPA